MDADTGEVLLLDGAPQAIEKNYPIGSVMKIFSGLYGLKSGTTIGGERVECTGKMNLYGKPVQCWDIKGHGPVNFNKALAYSCNVYFYHVGMRLNGSGFYDFLRAFGFGEKTGIDLPGEDAGVVPTILDPYERARSAVGLSRLVRATPLQVITAFAAVINGGKLVVPYMANGGGKNWVRRDLSDLGIGPFLPLVRRGMTEGATYGTTCGYYQTTGGYAKTGTAPWLHGYHTHGWFVGMLPLNRRRFAVLAFIYDGLGNRDALPMGIELAKTWKHRMEDKKEVTVSLFSLVSPKRLTVRGRFGFLTVGSEQFQNDETVRDTRLAEVRYLEPGQVRVVLDGQEVRWPEGKPVRIWRRSSRTGTGVLNVSVPGLGERDYDGRLTVRAGGRCLETVNTLTLRDYLKGVVGSEIGRSGEVWNEQILKVQAVISRTFSLKNIGRHIGDENEIGGTDFCDNTHCQHYTGRLYVSSAIEKAVRETGGLVLVDGKGDKKKLCDVFYHSTCGGGTNDYNGVWENRKIPYLKSIDDHGRCSASPHYRWKFSLEQNRFFRFLKKMTGYRVTGFRVLEADSGGWVKQVSVQCFPNIQKTYKGEEFHIAMGRDFGWNSLKSACFTVTRKINKERRIIKKRIWIFQGKGLGHGVGLCQWGARQLAKEGKGFREILSVYFPGALIGSVSF